MIEVNENEALFVEKYRPQTIDQCIIPDSLKQTFNGFIENGDIPNLILCGSAGVGKAMTMDTKILTPTGYIINRDIKLGDVVIGGDGNRCKVTGVFPQGARPIYRIRFSDHTHIDVSDHHLNSVIIHSGDHSSQQLVLTTEQLAERIAQGVTVSVPVSCVSDCCYNHPVSFDPYLFGVLCTSKYVCDYDVVTIQLRDEHVMNNVIEVLNNTNCQYNVAEFGDRYIVSFKRSTDNSFTSTVIDYLLNVTELSYFTNCGVVGDEWIYTSVANRRRFVQGVIDVLGVNSCEDDSIEVCIDNYNLSAVFESIVRSLGIIDECILTDKRRVTTNRFVSVHRLYGYERYSITIGAERIKDETYPVRARYIEDVSWIRDDDCQCIEVDSADHTFMIDDYVVTHNTTVARALTNQLGMEYLMINTSLESGIDVLRTKITNYVSSISLNGKPKVVLFDEADYASPAFQPALRAFIEKFSKNTRFIFTCNYPNRIIDPIKSRCTMIEFDFNRDKDLLVKQFLKRMIEIATTENIKFDPKAIAKIAVKYFPDFRRAINELQRASSGGSINDQTIALNDIDDYHKLIVALKTKNFKEMRQWVAVNKSIAPEKIYQYFYENANNIFVPTSIPQMVVTSADYQYKGAFVADQEINIAAYLTELMANCQFID